MCTNTTIGPGGGKCPYDDAKELDRPFLPHPDNGDGSPSDTPVRD